MKITFIIPGSGESFYCQNCLRDFGIVREFRRIGIDASVVPLYLPLNCESLPDLSRLPVFFGALNIYMREKIPLYGLVPEAARRLLDSRAALDLVAGIPASTGARGLESLTVSILEGREGRHNSELERLVQWLGKEERPDVVHISNALLLGVAERIASGLGIPVYCTVQDENQWIDSMDDEFRDKIYHLIGSKAASVRRFISVSEWYCDKFSSATGIATDKFSVIYPGIERGDYPRSSLPQDPPVIAFLSRISEESGFGILAEAFLLLKSGGRNFKDLKLKVSGGFSRGGRAYYEHAVSKIRDAGFGKDIYLAEDFESKSRAELLGGATVFSVPALLPEAFGLEILEAFAAGVPAVLPEIGAYPEIAALSGGAITYSPNSPEKLADALSSLLENRTKLQNLSHKASEAAGTVFSTRRCARKYRDLMF